MTTEGTFATRGLAPRVAKGPRESKIPPSCRKSVVFFLEDGFFFYNLELQNWQFKKSVKDCIPLLFLMNVPIPSSKIVKKIFFSLFLMKKRIFFSLFLKMMKKNLSFLYQIFQYLMKERTIIKENPEIRLFLFDIIRKKAVMK